jgi:stress-induced morphogen
MLHTFLDALETNTIFVCQVQDISGGCGSMYALDIESVKFKGLSIIKQHKLVNRILENEIKKWHGVQLKTRAP